MFKSANGSTLPITDMLHHVPAGEIISRNEQCTMAINKQFYLMWCLHFWRRSTEQEEKHCTVWDDITNRWTCTYVLACLEQQWPGIRKFMFYPSRLHQL